MHTHYEGDLAIAQGSRKEAVVCSIQQTGLLPLGEVIHGFQYMLERFLTHRTGRGGTAESVCRTGKLRRLYVSRGPGLTVLVG